MMSTASVSTAATTAIDRVILPQLVYPEHYALEITPDLEAFTFECNESITVRVNAPTNSVTLHAKVALPRSSNASPEAHLM